MLGPIGRFTLGKKPPQQAVLVAGGIGVTPMRAIARFVHDSKTPTKLILIHSADNYYLFKKEFKIYVPECHFVTKDTFVQTLQKTLKSVPSDTLFYLSGPPGFVTFADQTLRQLGCKHIRKDGFLGY